jgi:TrmH family RNA methyltransferase
MNTPGNQLIKEVAALRQKKAREETGLILVEGRHPIEEACRAGLRIKHYFIAEHAPSEGLPMVAVPVEPYMLDEKQMARIATTDSAPPCLAVFARPQPVSTQAGSFVLVLDRIQDPGNLGTLIRSAIAFGVESVLLTDDSVEMYSPKVIRASAGLVFALPMLVASRQEWIRQLSEPGWTVYGTTGHAHAESYRAVHYEGHCAIVLGNEGTGLADAWKQIPMRLLTIPMSNRVESLNVAISGAIILAEASARRKALQAAGQGG